MTGTGPAPSGTPSVRTILFGPDPDRAVEELAATLQREGVEEVVGEKTSRLSALGRRTVIEKVAAAMTPLLGVDLEDVLTEAWAKHDDLRAAGERTLGEEGSAEVVELATHRIASTFRPSVDVRVDGVPVKRVEGTVLVSVTVEGMLGVVEAGRLMELRSGRGTVDVRLSVAGAEIAQREVEVDLPGVVDLGDGLLLGMPGGDGAGARPGGPPTGLA